MKNVVSVQEILEFDIKPPEAVARWRGMVAEELNARRSSGSEWIKIDWPTCTPEQTRPAFERFGVSYLESTACGSLFAATRPDEDALRDWYRNSAPARFWREEILPASAASRREKIHRPRADWVLDGIAEYTPGAGRLVDLSTYGRGLVDLLLDENKTLQEFIAAGMTADLEGESATRLTVRPTPVAELPGIGEADVVIAIDVLDRTADVQALLASLQKLVKPGGVLFLTAAVSSGFEIQTLWGKSPSIIPPDKLNLPSVDALLKMFAAPVWEILELSTPGMFDVEMVRREIANAPDADWPRPVRALVERADHSDRVAFVEFLQARRLTSFARLVIRRLS